MKGPRTGSGSRAMVANLGITGDEPSDSATTVTTMLAVFRQTDRLTD